MAKITIFGGTGGLGSQILQSAPDVDRLGTKHIDLTQTYEIEKYFIKHTPDIVLFFNAYNINSFLHKFSILEINRMITANISGVTVATSAALKHMRQKGYGRIIFASSVVTRKDVAGTSVYAASKAYYENLVKTIAVENASKGITANCIQLGYMDGGLTYTLPKELLQQKLKEIPVGRLGTIAEIDKTIEFLINNEYVNGATINLTGGL